MTKGTPKVEGSFGAQTEEQRIAEEQKKAKEAQLKKTAQKLTSAQQEVQNQVNDKMKAIDPVKVAIFKEKHKDKLKAGSWSPEVNALFCKEVLGLDTEKMGQTAIAFAIQSVQEHYPEELKKFSVDGRMGPETFYGLLKHYSTDTKTTASVRNVMKKLATGNVVLDYLLLENQLKVGKKLDDYLKDEKTLKKLAEFLNISNLDELKRIITLIYLKKFNVNDVKGLQDSDQISMSDLIRSILRYIDNPRDFEIVPEAPFFLGFRIIEKNKPGNYLIGVEDNFKVRKEDDGMILLKNKVFL